MMLLLYLLVLVLWNNAVAGTKYSYIITTVSISRALSYYSYVVNRFFFCLFVVFAFLQFFVGCHVLFLCVLARPGKRRAKHHHRGNITDWHLLLDHQPLRRGVDALNLLPVRKELKLFFFVIFFFLPFLLFGAAAAVAAGVRQNGSSAHRGVLLFFLLLLLYEV